MNSYRDGGLRVAWTTLMPIPVTTRDWRAARRNAVSTRRVFEMHRAGKFVKAHNSKEAALNGIESVKKNAPDARVDDETAND
jgi:hypothetical protein